MYYNLIPIILKSKGLTKKALYEGMEMSKSGFEQAIKNDTLKVKDLEKIAEIFNVSPSVFFESGGSQNVSGVSESIVNYGSNSPTSIGSKMSQKGNFSTNKGSNDSEVLLLQEKIRSLEKELKRADQMIEILQAKN